jgi:poly(A) polymerase
VGAQFGVVLVRARSHWIEVATFRSDGVYLDGRRPSEVRFGTAEEDAHRRDFTVNGMFFDPLRGELLDHVGGRTDLKARLIRAIGDPHRRFAEDHLRLLRAVRFAAKLDCEIESATQMALVSMRDAVARVAPERIRDELVKMLSVSQRARAVQLLCETGVVMNLIEPSPWDERAVDEARPLLSAAFTERRSTGVGEHGLELLLTCLLRGQQKSAIDAACRRLTLTNQERECVHWLIEQSGELQRPEGVPLWRFKLLAADARFAALRQMEHGRIVADGGDIGAWEAAVESRVAAIPPEQLTPPPFVVGDDLLQRGLPQGPVYKCVLDALYHEQLDERLRTRDEALQRLNEILRELPPAKE